jgi:hypothetical protein
MSERGILARCEQGHEQRLCTPDMDEHEAAALAGLLDGTSTAYVYPPRDYPLAESVIAKCGTCQSWITCTLFGYGEVPD